MRILNSNLRSEVGGRHPHPFNPKMGSKWVKIDLHGSRKRKPPCLVLPDSANIGKLLYMRNVEAAATTAGSSGPLLVNNDWCLWGALLGCSFLAEAVDSTAIGKIIPKPMIAILLGFSLAGCGIIPLSCTTYDIVIRWFIPLAAVLYVLEADFSKLISTGGITLAAFAVGALGTVLGTLIAWFLVGQMLGPQGWKIASVLCATYIGGSINLITTGDVVGLTSGKLLAAVFAADNLVMALYLGIISLIPAKKASGWEAEKVFQHSSSLQGTSKFTTWLFVSCCSCAAGVIFSQHLGMPELNLAIAAVSASLARPIVCRMAQIFGWSTAQDDASLFSGCEALGSSLTMMFFVTLGAACGNAVEVLTAAPWIFGFIVIQITAHSAFMLAVCRVLKMPTRAVLTASNAGIGGPFTAAGMAEARGWDDMVQPAILTGTLGYAVGTYIGCTIGFFLFPS